MSIKERIGALRALMMEKGLDIWLVPSDDFHQSEYVGEHFKARAFITGFTGSAGTAVITSDEAGLWTDGRYFLQAAAQLEGSGVTLFRSGEPGVPTVEEYIGKTIPEGGVLGFDGRTVSAEMGRSLEKALRQKHARICCSEDLIGMIWEDRPPLSDRPAFALGEEYTGESTASKLSRVREAMRKEDADVHLLAALDDICWLTNLRGNDIEYFPLLLSYALITQEDMKLYVDERKLSDEIKAALRADHITLRPYGAVYEDVSALPDGVSVLADPARLNYALFRSIPETARVRRRTNPEVFMKAVKNETELENIIRAHKKDGVAVTRFMYWLKTNAGKLPITEISAAEKLEQLRREQEGYLKPSFEPICAFGAHAAIVHYSATPETDIPVTGNGFFLNDTGGGYMEGSTDITRTFALGDVPASMKEDFTTVLLGHLRLARAVFPAGTSGYSLDALARLALWERGLDFRHGTGHGVGYLMNIHEAPEGFRRTAPAKEKSSLEPGMVITDEPGLYVEGSHGIRIENELVVRKGMETEYGQFLYFEPITCVPIDLDAIEPGLLKPEDREQLNSYHAKVYETIAPYLPDKERAWLKTYTRAV